MRKIIFIIILILLFALNVQAATIKATVDRNIIPINEIIVLTLTADENMSEKPDLRVLNPNYEIYTTSVSHSSYVVNSKSSATTTWQIAIAPNKIGKQKIPSIKIGNDFSNEIEINVVKQEEYAANTATDEVKYSIKTQIDEHKTAYVQEMIPYNIIITDIGGLQGTEPVFDNNDDWIIKSLGQPDVISKYVNGRNVREIVFKYALFAQKSGKIKIPAVRFNGYTISSDRGGIFAGNILNINIGFPSGFGFETPINLVAPERHITILPVPRGYTNKWWLPAKRVEIKAELANNEQFIEGEAFSREITITAIGVVSSQLPELDFKSDSDLKLYPQKAISSDEVIDNEPVSTQKITIVYIPESDGTITLPPISLEWFDVTTQKIKKAEIKSQQIVVKPNPKLKNRMKENIQESNTDVLVKNINQQYKGLTLFKLSILLIGAVIIGLFIGYLLFRGHNDKNDKLSLKIKSYPDFIIKKAYENDFRALRDAIILWATDLYPEKNITGLYDVARAISNKDFSEQLDIITAKLYNPQNDNIFDGVKFVSIYKKVAYPKNKKSKNQYPLPKLYE